MPPVGALTRARNATLSARLWVWNDRGGNGVGFGSSAGFTLPNGFIHAPDTAWIARERWDRLTKAQKNSFAPICPDLVAELMPPSDRCVETREKLLEFMIQGARLGWLIDPDRRKVETHQPGRPYETQSAPRALSGEDILPGFVLAMKGILDDKGPSGPG